MRRPHLLLILVLAAISTAEAQYRVYPPGQLQPGPTRLYPPSLADGLIHYWPLDELSGPRADAIGGWGWGLSEVGGTLDTVAGKRYLAPNFTVAGGKYLSRASVVLPDTITVATWYKFVTPHTIATFFVATNAWTNSTQFALYQLGTVGAVNIVVLTSDGAANVFASNVNAVADGYHLIVGEYDAADKKVRLIVDGVAGSKSAALGGTLYRTASPLQVGFHASIGQADTPFDELMVWNRILTPAEHSSLYAAGAGKFYPLR